jgi:hypothetical protein
MLELKTSITPWFNMIVVGPQFLYYRAKYQKMIEMLPKY